MAVIKSQLGALIPTASIFLDIHDLKTTDDLELYIAQSQLVAIFLSQGYFSSPNCLREARAAVETCTPLVLIRETNLKRGGLTDEQARAHCLDELRVPIFDVLPVLREVVPWHRVAAFQVQWS